jgi:penicillin-binding protein 1B
MTPLKLWPWRKIAAAAGLLSLIVLIWLVSWLVSVDRDLRTRLDQGWFTPPVEFFSAPQILRVNETVNLRRLRENFLRWGWRERAADLVLHQGDFKLLPADLCDRLARDFSWPDDMDHCMNYWTPQSTESIWLVESKGRLVAIFNHQNDAKPAAELPAERFAQYYQGQPILRELVDIGQIPLYCSQAVTAIEDADFLEHRGISPTAIGRAMIRNLSKARFAEGGSTITQQLVKNYFLTAEKTLRRKITEQFMAVLLELRVDKDQILSNYLNEIYMGQHGSFQVRGFGAAAQFYFGKNLADLGLNECALLAAIINNPGRYNPFRQPERATQRRKLVLARMNELRMVSSEEAEAAAQSPLAVRATRSLTEPAPYFVHAVWEEIRSLGLGLNQGLRVFTTLLPSIQEKAQVGVLKHLEDLETRFPKLKTASARGPLQGALLVIDIPSGQIRALVGGRQFKVNQFNRIHQSRRQPGSLMKPIVYLAALESGDFTPGTKLIDEAWTYKYEGQVWKPRNYDGKFRGDVTMTEALANSLNVPTARLAVDVGIPTIVELAHRLGIESDLQPVPALSLGAAEVTPIEMAEAYLTIARRGQRLRPHLITRVEARDGGALFEFESDPEQVAPPEAVDQLVEMMKTAFVSGTAQAASAWGLPDQPAGKTGTTSDTKDNWFIGFNDELLTLVWLGFDDNSPTGLTGAGTALPLWYKVQYNR